MEKQKILHLLSSNKYTATENLICHSISILKDDFKFAYASPNGQISKYLRTNEVNYLPIEKMDYKSISEVINSYSPDIIHAHDYDTCILASKFSNNRKIIAQLHEEDENFKTFSFKSLAFKNSCKHFTKVIWPSENSKNNFRYIKTIKEKSITITPSIDCEKIIEKSNLSAETTEVQFDMLMFVDYMSIEEIQKVINILALLQGRGFTFKFGAISSNPFNEKIQSYLKETGVSDSFVWINKSESYHNLLSKAKILFIAKKYEETPIYALEANALGVPVISVFCNGLKNIIQNEYNGFLADNEYDLANFAARLLDDRHLWLLLSTNALTNAANQNDIEKYKTELINLYK